MKYILLFLLNFCVVSLSWASESPAVSPKVQQFIQSLEAKQKNLQGGAIAILHKNQVIYKNTFGHQQGNKGEITSTTLFPIASVSKPVSAVAIALLADKNKINFNKKYKIPYLQNDVTLKDLLSHTTGYAFSGNTQIEKGLSRSQMLAELKKQTPNCLPGKCYFYSNATYSLVEEALNAEGLNLHIAFNNLQKALNTKQIQILPLTTNTHIAYPHSTQKTLPFPKYYPSAAPAAAGVFASLDGLIDFYKLSFGYRPDLISQKTVNMLYQPVATTQDMGKWNINFPIDLHNIEAYYGLGWRIIHTKQYPNQKLIFHSGMIAGVRAYIGYIPNEEYGIIILANQDTAVPLESGLQFWKMFL